ncbi:HET-domain-containing protein [Hyaloscypha variabilis F]|uniref:HET-domain-containing protein n=1 Tax=Hyaloscypha variabilis (strain UAMH 11265 / GT02V1 / F) TaxID=1149755 RepID=A0A2J6SAZ8_HYAVF|nr:HET-domain-containing protein [Hyaloscypha variabilis F]
MLPFQYERLLEHDSIRLLVLEPSVEHSATIQCSLIHTTLDACKNDIIDHYTALSYVWGDPETSESILVAEKVFNITKNLFHALQDLRDNDRRRRLWIDAICIDQSNLFERNGQVSMMGSIYTQAQHTVIYLGRSTFGTELNFEVFSTNTTAVQNPIQRSSGIRSVAEEILSRPWFTRVWIFQELVLSQDPWIQCGRSRMQWDEALGAIQSVSIYGKDVPNIYKVAFNMQEIRRKFQAAKFDSTISRPELVQILQSRRGFGASDPRDRVFAHLGIASALHQDSIQNVSRLW